MKFIRALGLSLFVCAIAAAQNAALMPIPQQPWLDNNGLPLAGGYIYTCVAGTSCAPATAGQPPLNPLATYTDSTAATQRTNPIVLDSGGFAQGGIWLGSSAYEIVVQNSAGVTIWTVNNVTTAALTATSASSASTATTASTAAALANSPSVCSGNPALGIAANGNATCSNNGPFTTNPSSFTSAGLYWAWDYSGTGGESDFFNSPGSGTGNAFNWYECLSGTCTLVAGLNQSGQFKPNTYATATTCFSSASPAVCSSAAAGSVVIAASSTSVQVNTSAIGANSQILVTFDSSLGSKLSVTCNSTFAAPYVSARTAGSSFTISTGSAPSTNPACYSYSIINY